MLPLLQTLFNDCQPKCTAGPFGSLAGSLPFAPPVRRKATVPSITPPSISHFKRITFGRLLQCLPQLLPAALTLLACLLVAVFCSSPARAQHIDSFEAGPPKFRLLRDDARAVLGQPSKTEPGVETIEVTHGNGSFVFLIYAIEPCAIIPELNASIRIRSAQSGVKIGFRVVFPRARHPATHGALTEIILGTPHDGAGRWSTSTISNIVPLVEDRQRFLRRRFGPEVDLREPYIDAVILNAYGSPGTNRLQVDDLVVDGMIAPGASVESTDATGQLTALDAPTGEQLRLLQTTVPRWVQHQGESLAFLQTLGFTGVITRSQNDPLVIEQAAETGMGLIMPPPSLVPTESQVDQYKHVSAWLLGLSLNQSQIDSSRQRVAMMSRFPRTLARPMVGEAWELYGSYSRLSDWMAIPMPLATTVRSSQEAARILQSDMRPIAGRHAPITSIWTQLSTEWLAQRAITSQTLGREPWVLPDHDRLQSRLQLMRSIMQGSRGWIFRSPTPLDAGDETATARAESYISLNREIELLMPWIQANESTWRNIQVDSTNHTAAILETPNSQLVIVVASGPWDQICSPAPSPEKLSITLPVSGQPRQVYRITNGELERCPTLARPGAMIVTIDRPALVEQIVSVVDNGPVTYLREALTRITPALVEGRIDTATQLLQIAQMNFVAQQLPAGDPSWEQVLQAQSAQRAATSFLARSELPRAMQAADRAILLAQANIRSTWESAQQQFPSVASSPLVASPLSLPLHWELDRVLRSRSWQSIPLPGAPFTNTAAWKQSGWRSDHRLADTVDSSAQISPQTGPSGTPVMLLQATSRNTQPIPSGYAGASMRVTSPRIPLPFGSLVHIEGLVQVASATEQSQSGLLVCDNLGGEALGQLVSSFDPSENAWRRISLFRMVTQEDGLELYFETRGQVQAAITDLSIEMIMPTQNRNLPISTSSPPVDLPE